MYELCPQAKPEKALSLLASDRLREARALLGDISTKENPDLYIINSNRYSPVSVSLRPGMRKELLEVVRPMASATAASAGNLCLPHCARSPVSQSFGMVLLTPDVSPSLLMLRTRSQKYLSSQMISVAFSHRQVPGPRKPSRVYRETGGTLRSLTPEAKHLSPQTRSE